MKKVEIIKPIWNFEIGKKVSLKNDLAEFAIKRGKAKAIDVEYQKKVIDSIPKNKEVKKKRKPNTDFIGSKNFE